MNVFVNIPDSLNVGLKMFYTQVPDKYYLAAGLVVCEYLRFNALEPSKDEFLKNNKNAEGGLDFDHTVKIKIIGETIFLLRGLSSFPEMCRRLRERDLKSTFYELFYARCFYLSGFDVLTKAETGVRGKDYDFEAHKNSTKINVEVTALDEDVATIQSLKNALDSKRTQLPATESNILICVLPEKWLHLYNNLEEQLMETARNFLRNSKRINALLFVNERHITLVPDGSLGLITWDIRIIKNDHPRNFVNLDFLEEENFSTISILDITKEPDNEFFKWVDHVTAS